MPKVKIDRASEERLISQCNAGCYAVVTKADCQDKVGALVRLPWASDESLIFFDRYIASTDRYRGVEKVIPLTKGDSFTIILE